MMVAEIEDRGLSVGASLMVWLVASVVGWVALVGIGYSVYQVGGDFIGSDSASNTEPAVVGLSGSSDTKVRQLQMYTPSAGGK